MSTGPERIANAFEQARLAGRMALMPYVTIGFPELGDTVGIVEALEAAGSAVIELGVPYSDPLADGPTIQAASYTALQNGIDTAACLETVRAIRAAGVITPLLFMGYYNPILSYGIENYARDCADAGLDGLLVPDLPPEENGPMRQALDANGLALIPMVAPTSTEERIRQACAGAGGFVYCVSVAGVTGVRADLSPALADFVARVRTHTTLPLAVGFGISERRHVEQLAEIVQGAVVGTRMIEVIDSAPPHERAARAGAFAAELLGHSEPAGSTQR